MITYNRICIKDYEIKAQSGQRFELKRGKEYLTSEIEDGLVWVFSQFWVQAPVAIFAGEQIFTGV